MSAFKFSVFDMLCLLRISSVFIFILYAHLGLPSVRFCIQFLGLCCPFCHIISVLLFCCIVVPGDDVSCSDSSMGVCAYVAVFCVWIRTKLPRQLLYKQDQVGVVQESCRSSLCDDLCLRLCVQVRAGSLQELIYKQGQAGVTKATVTIVFNNKDKKGSPVGYESYDELTVCRQVCARHISTARVRGDSLAQN